ncbi:putative carboxylesterase 2 [Wolffia australiana]
MDTPELDVAENLAPLLVIHHDGRMECLKLAKFVPPSLHSAAGASSKDMTIDAATGVSARLFLPTAAAEKLPILFYIHGGAFCIESATSPLYHCHLLSLSTQAGALCVSIDYRLAPEHPLPAAYGDAWAALRWAAVRADPWLAEHGDFSDFFLAGDSACANLAHNLAVRANLHNGFLQTNDIIISGLALIHPYIWFCDLHGELSYMNEQNANGEPCMNPVAEEAPSLAGLRCRKVLVCIVGVDFLREQGECYLGTLKKSGFEADIMTHFAPIKCFFYDGRGIRMYKCSRLSAENLCDGEKLESVGSSILGVAGVVTGLGQDQAGTSRRDGSSRSADWPLAAGSIDRGAAAPHNDGT